MQTIDKLIQEYQGSLKEEEKQMKLNSEQIHQQIFKFTDNLKSLPEADVNSLFTDAI